MNNAYFTIGQEHLDAMNNSFFCRYGLAGKYASSGILFYLGSGLVQGDMFIFIAFSNMEELFVVERGFIRPIGIGDYKGRDQADSYANQMPDYNIVYAHNNTSAWVIGALLPGLFRLPRKSMLTIKHY